MTSEPKFDLNAPIGVFDSGLGGLTVVSQMMRLLPAERILFLADQAHVPYGGRDLSEVCNFACGISDALFHAGCKAVVMACNISSASALTTVQSLYPDELIMGVIEPGANGAARSTVNGRIGVLTTVGTAKSGAYTRAFRAIDPALFVLEVPCPAFVPLVEGDAMETPEALMAVQEYLAPLLEAGTDTVVLGCTHYPFLLPVLRKAAPHLRFVDPAEHTTVELIRALEDRRLIAPTASAVPSWFATTGPSTHFEGQLRRFIRVANDRFAIASSEWIGEQLSLSHP